MGITSIEWCDYTFNHVRGCAKVSPGCTNCYADRMSKRNPSTLGQWGPSGTRVVAAASYWKLPEKWNRDAQFAHEYWLQRVDVEKPPHVRPRVFCASLADVFEDWDGQVTTHEGLTLWQCGNCQCWKSGAKPSVQKLGPACCGTPTNPVTLDDVRRRLFQMIDDTPNLDWLLLTKRPENVRRMWPDIPCDACGEVTCAPHRTGVLDRRHRENVWLGTSVEEQKRADERIPELLKCRDLASVLFLSCEPLLGPVDLVQAHMTKERPPNWPEPNRVDWVIVGGESGPKARPMHPQWACDIRDQCNAAGVPFFYKQTGEWLGSMQDGAPGENQHINCSNDPIRIGKKKAGRLLDGREWNEFPEGEKVST